MQIKVNDTRMHKFSEKQISPVPVAGAKLVLVEDPDAPIKDRYYIQDKSTYKYFKPILISETEKIEVGDRFLDCRPLFFGKIHTNAGLTKAEGFEGWYKSDTGIIFDPKQVAKILALPEHFSINQRQAIVDGKMKDGDKVLVECKYSTEEECNCFKADIGDECHEPKHNDAISVIKLNSSNNITLHKIEEKMVPVALVERAYNEGYGNGANRKSIDFKVWFEQNVK